MKKPTVLAEDLEHYSERAKRVFSKYWPALVDEHRDDFAQYCVVQWLQGRHAHVDIKLLAIDYLRENSFTKSRGSGDLMVRLDRDWSDPADMLKRIASGPDHQNLDILLDRIKDLNERERIVLMLYYQWGMRLREISVIMNLSNSMACVIKASGEKKCKEFHQEPKDRVHT